MMNDQTKGKLYKAITSALLASVIAASLILLKSKQTQKISPVSLDNFAKCLAVKNITMYGADWCPHCQNEKKSFGESFKYVPYVECPKEPKLCLEKGIEGYPTWILPGDQKLKGIQGLNRLSLLSGCLLEKTVK